MVSMNMGVYAVADREVQFADQGGIAIVLFKHRIDNNGFEG